MKTMLAVAAALLAPHAVWAAQVTTAALDAPEKSADKGDRIICKSYPVIGSLVATEKVCRTKRDWDNTRSNLYARGAPGSCAGPGGPTGGTCQ